MTPADLVRASIVVFLAATPAIIAYQILTGRIAMAGLLYERAPDGQLVYSPARVQLLLVTLIGVATYLARFGQNPAELPAIDPGLLTGIGGSQAIYLGCKAWAGYQADKP